jgi:hypothetical protein
MPEIQIIAKDNHKTLVTTEELCKTFRSVSCVVKVAASDVLVVNREGTTQSYV